MNAEHNGQLQPPQRYLWADWFRGLLMALVIAGHAIDKSAAYETAIGIQIDYWIYTFHIPCFFALSGYLFKGSQTDFFERLIRRIWCIAVPTIAASLIFAVLSLLFGAYRFDASLLMRTAGLFWFCWMLLAVYCICSVWYYLAEKRKWRYGSAALCVVSFLAFLISGVFWNVIGMFFGYLFAFAMGHWLSASDFICKIKKWQLIPMLFIFIGLGLIFQKTLGIYAARENCYTRILMGSLLFFVAVKWLPTRAFSRNSVLAYVGRNSLQFYLFHVLGMFLAIYILTCFSGLEFGPWIQCGILCAAACIVSGISCGGLSKIKALRSVFWPKDLPYRFRKVREENGN